MRNCNRSAKFAKSTDGFRIHVYYYGNTHFIFVESKMTFKPFRYHQQTFEEEKKTTTTCNPLSVYLQHFSSA